MRESSLSTLTDASLNCDFLKPLPLALPSYLPPLGLVLYGGPNHTKGVEGGLRTTDRNLYARSTLGAQPVVQEDQCGTTVKPGRSTAYRVL